MEEYPSVLDTPEYKLTKIAIHAARAYYDKETFDHAKRVADYTSDNEAIPFDIRNECWCVAMMHEPVEEKTFNGCSDCSHCRFCGKKIMMDSQGNWFQY